MTLAIDQPPPPRVKKWTKREYMELVDHFHGQHVYLFRGELIEMSPQLHPHAFAVTRLVPALVRAFGLDSGFEIRVQLPFAVPGETLPEPDGLVCTAAQFMRQPHPNAGVLVIEVADSSLSLDRAKAFEYAAAQIPEYWIIDVQSRRVEVYRDPILDKSAELSFRYPTPTIVEMGESIEPLVVPGVKVSVAQFFCTP